MKSIFKSLLTITAVMVLTAGATSAYFSDQDISEPNVFTSGTVDVDISQQSMSGDLDFLPGSRYDLEFFSTKFWFIADSP